MLSEVEFSNAGPDTDLMGWFNKQASFSVEMAATALDAASKHLREYNQDDRPAEKEVVGEGRDDVQMVVGSRDNERDAAAANVPLSVSFESSVKFLPTANPSITSRRSTKAASISGRSKAAPSVSSRRSKAASVKAEVGVIEAAKAAPSVSSRRSKAASVKNEMRAIEAADALIDDNVSHAKSRKSMRSTLSKKEAQSRKSLKNEIRPIEAAADDLIGDTISHAKSRKSTAPKTKPLDMVQVDNSSKKEMPSLTSSQRKTQTDAEFWSGLSIRVALAVMKAKGSQQIAQKASCLVLDEGRMQSGNELSNEMLQAFSMKLSTALMAAVGDEQVAAAAALAVVESQPSVNSGEPIEIDNITVATFGTKRSNLTKASKKSKKGVSTTPSFSSKKRKLLSIEKEIEATKRSIEEAEFRRIAALEAATKKLLIGMGSDDMPKEIEAKISIDGEESFAPSLASTARRQKLQSVEQEIEAKKKAIEEAELWNMEREREFYERIAMLEAAMNAKVHGLMSALDEATVQQSMLEKGSATQFTQTSKEAAEGGERKQQQKEEEEEEEQEEEEDCKEKVSLWRRLMCRSKSSRSSPRADKSAFGSETTERTTNTTAVRRQASDRVSYHQTLPRRRRRFRLWRSKKDDLPEGCCAI